MCLKWSSAKNKCCRNVIKLIFSGIFSFLCVFCQSSHSNSQDFVPKDLGNRNGSPWKKDRESKRERQALLLFLWIKTLHIGENIKNIHLRQQTRQKIVIRTSQPAPAFPVNRIPLKGKEGREHTGDVVHPSGQTPAWALGGSLLLQRTGPRILGWSQGGDFKHTHTLTHAVHCSRRIQVGALSKTHSSKKTLNKKLLHGTQTSSDKWGPREPHKFCNT